VSKLPRRSRKRSAEIDTDKVGKLVRLMLSTDRDGEALAAVGALKRALDVAGLDCHAVADAIEAGLRPMPQRPASTWGPPEPDLTNWQSMCWFLHFHRDRLRGDQRERVADYLLGTAFDEYEGVCTAEHLRELRQLVAIIRTGW
jgi:hypothetical protein